MIFLSLFSLVLSLKHLQWFFALCNLRFMYQLELKQLKSLSLSSRQSHRSGGPHRATGLGGHTLLCLPACGIVLHPEMSFVTPGFWTWHALSSFSQLVALISVFTNGTTEVQSKTHGAEFQIWDSTGHFQAKDRPVIGEGTNKKAFGFHTTCILALDSVCMFYFQWIA